MMSLVASPVVVARAAAPKRTARKPTAAIAQASVSVSSAGAKKIAFVGAVSLAMSASPALAAMELAFPAPQAQEIAMVADADDEKKAARKAAAAALAASLQKDFVAKVASEGKVVTSGTKPEKTKNLSFTGPSLSAPSFSNPFGGEKKAADSPAAPAAPVAAKEPPNYKLGLAMAVLFSPLLAVGAFSIYTLVRVVPQAVGGKDFFTKDTLPF